MPGVIFKQVAKTVRNECENILHSYPEFIIPGQVGCGSAKYLTKSLRNTRTRGRLDNLSQ